MSSFTRIQQLSRVLKLGRETNEVTLLPPPTRRSQGPGRDHVNSCRRGVSFHDPSTRSPLSSADSAHKPILLLLYRVVLATVQAAARCRCRMKGDVPPCGRLLEGKQGIGPLRSPIASPADLTTTVPRMGHAPNLREQDEHRTVTTKGEKGAQRSGNMSDGIVLNPGYCARRASRATN